MPLRTLNDYSALFLNDTPLIDVRAPVEFTQGAFPTAVNLPLMTDEERHRVGIEYAQRGRQAAIELGVHLVSGAAKQCRTQAWATFADAHPDGALYCARGGLRSCISQQWLYAQTGIDYPRIQGGYRALRRYLLDRLDAIPGTLRARVVGGRTGAGKTRFLKRFRNHIDLEDLARHRGSAFGPRAWPQPTQIDFENALAIRLLKLGGGDNAPLVFEDESNNIGSRRTGQALYRALCAAPLYLLEADLETRIEITWQNYVVDALGEYCRCHGDDRGFAIWSATLLAQLDKIQRRLGGARHRQLRVVLQSALRRHAQGDPDQHRDWIGVLLTQYYDPMYDYQLSRKAARIAARGDADALDSALRAAGAA